MRPPIDKLPNRIKTYLINFRFKHGDRFWVLFKKDNISDLTEKEILEFFDYSTKYDRNLIVKNLNDN